MTGLRLPSGPMPTANPHVWCQETFGGWTHQCSVPAVVRHGVTGDAWCAEHALSNYAERVDGNGNDVGEGLGNLIRLDGLGDVTEEWLEGTEAPRLTLESCICGQCFDCPDGWHPTDAEQPCGCTADCALAERGEAQS